MPVSSIYNLPYIVQEACRLRPGNILDLGVGWGLVGAALRQYLDIAQGRISKKDWKLILCGVEGFPSYRNPLWQVYDFVEQADFSDPTEVIRYRDHDLVVLADSLEHVDGRTGTWLLDTLLMQNKHVIVSVPVGNSYLPQDAVNGNEFERHRHEWTVDDLVVRGAKILYSGSCVVASIPGVKI